MDLTRQELQQGQLSPERMAEAMRTFRDTGLLTLDNAFDRAFIAQVRAAYDAELERYLTDLGGMSALDGKTFGKHHIGFYLPLTMPFADPQIAAHPVAVQVMAELLGKDLQCSFYHSNTAYPGSTYQPVHRDSGFLFGSEMLLPHPVVSLVQNIPLCDFTEENGSTEVWPGSHLIVDASLEDAKALEARAALLPSLRMNVRAGALVLRDLRCWHRGVPNRSDHSRAMFAFIYQRGWLHTDTVTIPKSTWEAWPESARHIFRRNTVVEDVEYRPRVRDYGA